MLKSLSQHQIKINLPESAETTERSEDKIIEVTIDKDGFVYRFSIYSNLSGEGDPYVMYTYAP